MRLRRFLRIRQLQLRLEPAQFEIGIGSLRRNRDVYGRLTEFGRLGLRACGVTSTAQRTEQIKFPGSPCAGRIGLVVAGGAGRVG